MRAGEYGVITTTFPSHAQAARAGDVLLAEKLAACIQLIGIESRYAWAGEIKLQAEVMLLAKTRTALFEAAIARIAALHPYEVPEILAQEFAAGSPAYLGWIGTSTGGWCRAVLDFWFAELSPQDWFGGGAAVDDAIRARFADLTRELHDAPPAPQGALEHLAAILVFDQFPRNLFRGQAQAFATDALALGLARDAIAQGLDTGLSAHQRQFLYMPLVHAEDAAAQTEAVALFEKLDLPQAFDFARAHRAVVARFGRFPGRNAALGRVSSAAEREFLETEPQRF